MFLPDQRHKDNKSYQFQTIQSDKESMALIYLFLSVALSANLGHRACGGSGGYFKKLPENTIASVKACLQGVDGFVLQDEKDFDYLEFDVQETLDHQLVLFHDSSLGKNFQRDENIEMMEKIEENVRIRKNQSRKKSFKRLSIKDLTLEELQSLYVVGEGNEVVPKLSDFLYAVADSGLRKPLILEIKNIYSDIAWQEMLGLMYSFKTTYMDVNPITVEDSFDFPGVISFLGFKSSVKKSLGKIGGDRHTYWCNQIRSAGLHGIYRPIFHSKNYCK